MIFAADCARSAAASAPTSSTTCCPCWSATPTTWRPWWTRGPGCWARRRGGRRRCCTRCCPGRSRISSCRSVAAAALVVVVVVVVALLLLFLVVVVVSAAAVIVDGLAVAAGFPFPLSFSSCIFYCFCCCGRVHCFLYILLLFVPLLPFSRNCDCMEISCTILASAKKFSPPLENRVSSRNRYSVRRPATQN